MAEKINLNFLGTGSAIPTARRNHPAVLLQYKEENILIDCGEGTQRQFRYAKLNPCKLTRILITHWHADHVLGIPGILQTLILNGYNKKLKICGPSGTKKMMSIYIGLFAHKGGKFPIEVDEVSGKFVDEDEFLIEAEKMEHDTPTNAYSFVIKEKTRLDKQKLKKLEIPNSPLLGELARGRAVTIAGKKLEPKKFLYKEKQRKITFIMDTCYNEKAVRFAKNSDLLVCESTYSDDDKELAEEHKHLTAKLAGTIAKKAGVKKLILTHLSQRNETPEGQKKILGEARKIFSKTDLAKDLDIEVI